MNIQSSPLKLPEHLALTLMKNNRPLKNPEVYSTNPEAISISSEVTLTNRPINVFLVPNTKLNDLTVLQPPIDDHPDPPPEPTTTTVHLQGDTLPDPTLELDVSTVLLDALIVLLDVW